MNWSGKVQENIPLNKIKTMERITTKIVTFVIFITFIGGFIGMLAIMNYIGPNLYATKYVKLYLVKDISGESGGKSSHPIVIHKFKDEAGNMTNINALECQGGRALKCGDSVIAEYGMYFYRLIKADSFSRCNNYKKI